MCIRDVRQNHDPGIKAGYILYMFKRRGILRNLFPVKNLSVDTQRGVHVVARVGVAIVAVVNQVEEVHLDMRS